MKQHIWFQQRYGCVKDSENEQPQTQRNTAAHPNVQLSRKNIKKLSFTFFMTYHPLDTTSTNLRCSGFHEDCTAIKWKINMKSSNLPSQFPSLQLWMLLTTGNPHQMYAQVYFLHTEKYVSGLLITLYRAQRFANWEKDLLAFVKMPWNCDVQIQRA